MNMGVAEAKGELLAFMHADTSHAPDGLPQVGDASKGGCVCLCVWHDLMNTPDPCVPF